jgi:hypothetical protein
MKRCKYCGKQVSADHDCPSAKAVVPYSGGDSWVEAAADLIGDVFDSIGDIDFS